MPGLQSLLQQQFNPQRAAQRGLPGPVKGLASLGGYLGDEVERSQFYRDQAQQQMVAEERDGYLSGGNELGGIATGVRAGVKALAAPLVRAVGPSLLQGAADKLESLAPDSAQSLRRMAVDPAGDMQRRSAAQVAAQQENVKANEFWGPRNWLNETVPGVAQSMSQMLALAPAGMAGLAAGFAATTADQEYTVARDLGLGEEQAGRYAFNQGVLEAVPMLAFSGAARVLGKAQLAGVEGMFAKGFAKQFAKEVPGTFRNWVKKELTPRVLSELAEEEITSIAQAVNTAATLPGRANVDDWIGEDGSIWNSPMMDTVRQTFSQTVLTMGIAETPNAVRSFVQSPTRTNFDKLSKKITKGKKQGKNEREELATQLQQAEEFGRLDELLSDDGPDTEGTLPPRAGPVSADVSAPSEDRQPTMAEAMQIFNVRPGDVLIDQVWEAVQAGRYKPTVRGAFEQTVEIASREGLIQSRADVAAASNVKTREQSIAFVQSLYDRRQQASSPVNPTDTVATVSPDPAVNPEFSAVVPESVARPLDVNPAQQAVDRILGGMDPGERSVVLEHLDQLGATTAEEQLAYLDPQQETGDDLPPEDLVEGSNDTQPDRVPTPPAAESETVRQPWEMTQEKYFDDPERVRSDVGNAASGWKVSYTYVTPSAGGPFKGSQTLQEKPKKGDVIPAMFGQATVTGAVKAKSGKMDNAQLRKAGIAKHREFVADALAAGQPVPAEVLAEYPDLQTTLPDNTAEPAGDRPGDRSGAPQGRGLFGDDAAVAKSQPLTFINDEGQEILLDPNDPIVATGKYRMVRNERSGYDAIPGDVPIPEFKTEEEAQEAVDKFSDEMEAKYGQEAADHIPGTATGGFIGVPYGREAYDNSPLTAEEIGQYRLLLAGRGNVEAYNRTQMVDGVMEQVIDGPVEQADIRGFVDEKYRNERLHELLGSAGQRSVPDGFEHDVFSFLFKKAVPTSSPEYMKIAGQDEHFLTAVLDARGRGNKTYDPLLRQFASLYTGITGREFSKVSGLLPDKTAVAPAPELGVESTEPASSPVSVSAKPLQPDDLPDAPTANKGRWFHGGPEAISAPSSSFTDPAGLFAGGFYMTDDMTVGQEYAKDKGVVGEFRVEVRDVINLEKPLPETAKAAIRESFPDQLLEDVPFDTGTAGEVITAISQAVEDESYGEQIPKSEYYELFQAFEANLREAGFDALTHIGGRRAGKGKRDHRVLILLDPQNEYSGNAALPVTVRPVAAPSSEQQADPARPETALEPSSQAAAPAVKPPTVARLNQRISGNPVSNDTGPGVTVEDVKAIAHEKHYTVKKTKFGKDTSRLEGKLRSVEADIADLQRKLAEDVYEDPLDREEDRGKLMPLERSAETHRMAIRLRRAGSAIVVESKGKGEKQKFYVLSDGMVLQEGYSDAFTLDDLKDELAETADPTDTVGMPAEEEAMPYQGPVPRTRPDPVDPEDAKPIGMNWPTQTESTTENRVPVSQITRSIQEAVQEVNENFRWRTGRMGIGGRKLRGIYNRLTGIARTQKSNDLPGGLHEAAHALKEAVSNGGSLEASLPPNVQSDLVELGKRTGEEEPTNGWLDEGFSEYVRMWGTVPEAAQQVAPNATTWFEEQFLPSLPNEGQAWRKVKAELQTWEQQGGAARINESLVRMEVWKEKRRKWKENAKKLLSAEAWFEMFLPYKRLDEQRAKQLGRPLRPEEKTYEPAKATRMSHYGQALDWARNGVRGLNNVLLSRPLNELATLIPQDQKNDFWTYAAARRTVALAENKPAMRRHLSTAANPVTYSEQDGFRYANGTAVPQAQLDAAKKATYRDAGPWSEADARQVVSDFDNPRFREAFDLVREVDDAKYKYAGIASPTLKAVGDVIMKNDAGDHIPMHAIFREIDNDYRAETKNRTSNAAQGTLGKRLSKRGSKRERRHPLEVMVEDLVSVIATTNERFIIDRVIAASEAFRPDVGETVEWVTAARKTRSGMLEKWNDDGTATVRRSNGRSVIIRKPDHLRRSGNHGQLGYIINEVPPDLVKAADRSMDQIVDEIARKVRAKGGELLLVKEDGSEMKSQELAGEVMSFFTTARQVPGFDNPIVSYYDGVQKKVRWFEVDKNLMGALKGMSMQKLPAALRWMTGPVRTMKMGNVIYNPSFGLIRNPIRDLQDSYQTTASNESPKAMIRDTIMGTLTAARVVGQQWKGLGQRAKHVASGDKSQAVTADPYAAMSGAMKFFQRYGGGISTMVGVDQAATMDLVREIEGDLGVIDVGKDLVSTFRDTVGMAESVLRVRELDHLAKEMGVTNFEAEMPIDQVLTLMLAAKENAGPDFSANGYIGRYVNQLDPFANVAFQAARTQARAFKRDPKKFAGRAATFMATGIAYWAMNKDEEWYKRLGSAKYHNYYWKVGDNVLKLPRGQYSGTLIAGIIESMFDAAYQRDPEGLAQFAEQALEVLLPNTLPLAVQEARDQWKNEDSFFNMKIVPPGLETLPPSEQADLYTTRLSTLIGAATAPLWPELQISPKRLDHAMKSFFGAAPQDALDLIGLGKASTGREWEAADFPVFGTLFVAGGTAGRRPKPVSDLYDLHQKFLDRKDSRFYPETETDKRVRLMLQDTTKSISMLSQLQHLGIPADGVGYNQWRLGMGRLIESTEDTVRKGHLKALLDAAEPGQQLLSQKDQRSITKLKAEIAEDTLAYAKAGKLPSASMAKAAYALSAKHPTPREHEFPEEFKARKAAALEERVSLVGILKEQGIPPETLGRELARYYFQRHGVAKSPAARKKQQAEIQQRLKSLHYHLRKD